jgi:hypothetical protein
MRFVKLESGKIIDLSVFAPKIMDNPEASRDFQIYRDTYGHGKIIGQSDDIFELFNRFIIKSRLNYAIKTKHSFGKLSIKTLIKDIISGRRQFYACTWHFGEHKEPILQPAAIMNSDGGWTLL